MPRTSPFAFWLPLLPVALGSVGCVWFFRSDAAVPGLASALGGVLLMMFVATRLPADSGAD
jgi:hypothetical protein